MVHAHFMLDTLEYRYTHTLRFCKTHCFSTATMVARTRLNVTLHFFVCLIYLYFEIKKDFAEIIEKNSLGLVWFFFNLCK